MRQPSRVIKVSLIFSCFSLASASQPASAGEAQPTYRITRAAGPIEIDGVLDDAGWQAALRIAVDIEVQPGENLPAPVSAECLLTFDQRALYVGCRCFDPQPQAIRAHLSDRDALWRNDYVGVILDTFNDRRRAYQFFVNPLGVQADSLRNEVASDHHHHEDTTWDAIWESAARITPEGYLVEMAIPFRSLRFPNGSSSHTWGIAMFRAYPRTVRHQILSVPLDRSNNCFLCQSALLEGLDGIAPGRDVELTPTLTSHRVDTLLEENHPSVGLDPGQLDTEAGITARWGVTPNLSLHATVNPDFSQVEADAAELQVNTRFALFFPEKRPFFMEGADFFSTPINAVYTRAVADPIWGLRSTGKLGSQAYSVFVAKDRLLNLLFPSKEGSSYGSYDIVNTSGAFRYRHDVGRASTLGVIGTAREGGEYRNRVVGVDGLLRLTPTDTLNFQLLRSLTRYPGHIAAEEGQREGDISGSALEVEYRRATRNWGAWAWYRSIDPEFRADLGFVSQVDTRGGEIGGQRIFWGKSGQALTRASVGAEFQRFEDHTGNLVESTGDLFTRLEGPFQSMLHLRAVSFKESYEGQIYSGIRTNFFFNIRPSGSLTTSLGGRWGDAVDYVNCRPGRSARLQPGLTLNLGRHLSLELDHRWERLQVDEGQLYLANLAQAKAVYQFSANIFARVVVQYLNLDRNPSLYRTRVPAESSNLFTQFLFSYKLNPQTVAFVGYSDQREGEERMDLARTNRTFFLKLGYAWQL